MDTARLATSLTFLKGDEREFKVQEKLAALRESLSNLSSNPGEATFQSTFVTNLRDLRHTLNMLIATYSPSQKEGIFSLGAAPFFSSVLANRIQRSVSQNPVSPSVTLQLVDEIISERESYLRRINEVLSGLEGFQLAEDGRPDGQPDIGFEIPRQLFSNKFDGLVDELRVLNRALRIISEVETGSVSEITLHDISASDPFFFLGMDPLVLVSIGLIFKWATTEWKKIEEIRKLRAETAKLKHVDTPQIEQILDDAAKKAVDDAITKMAASMLHRSPLDQPRKNEIDDQLVWAISALFSRFEHGMQIEIRGSLPDPKNPEKDNLGENVRTQFEAVRNLAFPKRGGVPILPLTIGNDNQGSD